MQTLRTPNLTMRMRARDAAPPSSRRPSSIDSTRAPSSGVRRTSSSPSLAPSLAPKLARITPPSTVLRDLGVGGRLRQERELLGMSVEEISRATRIPVASIELLERNSFDALPGDVFVRGFLRSYARTLGIDADELLAAHDRHAPSSRRTEPELPVPPPSSAPVANGRRIGVALAVVLLLVLCTMALSFVLKPRGRDVPTEISSRALVGDRVG